MRIKYFFLIVIFLTYSLSYSQWTLLNTGNGFNIHDFSFPNAQTGYICGYGGLLKKTTDGGLTWINMSFPTTQFDNNAVHFFNANNGLVASDNDTIYRTLNGTQQWSDKIYIGFHILDFQFFDSLNGYAAGNNKFAATTNGGLNWTINTIQTDGQIFFINYNTGWTVKSAGSGTSTLLKTIDAGLNWQVQLSTSDYKILYDVYFTDSNTGYASGYRHSIFKTTDGGVNWNIQLTEVSAGGLYSIYFINPQTGWATGDLYSTTNASTYYTVNGGQNWIPVSEISGAGRLRRVKVNNSPIGYIAGQSQRIYKTTNAGGLTYSVNVQESKPAVFRILDNYPNPFNPVTKIRFEVPAGQQIKIKIIDVSGREIKEIMNSNFPAGIFETDFDGSDLPSGVYICKMESANFSDSRKIVLVK